IPQFTEAQIVEIADLVDVYKDLRYAYSDEPIPWQGQLAAQGRRALLKIDAAVLEAYDLPKELESALLEHFNGANRGHLPFVFNGYNPDEWVAAKAELADDREGRRIADEFNILLRKQNLYGLTAAEQQEYDRLARIRTQRQNRYHT